MLLYTFCLTLAFVHAAPPPDDVTLSDDVTHQPNDVTHQSDNGVRRPDTGDQMPDSGVQQPDTGGQLPDTGAQRAVTDVQRPDNETRHLQLKALEQVKDELYQQLQEAVSDTVQELNRSGDAAALQQMKELQQRLNDAAPQRYDSVPARRQFDQVSVDIR